MLPSPPSPGSARYSPGKRGRDFDAALASPQGGGKFNGPQGGLAR
jgi:hypothetical protein